MMPAHRFTMNRTKMQRRVVMVWSPIRQGGIDVPHFETGRRRRLRRKDLAVPRPSAWPANWSPIPLLSLGLHNRVERPELADGAVSLDNLRRGGGARLEVEGGRCQVGRARREGD